MTARELSAYIGTHVLVEPITGLQFQCKVTDAKISYGRERLEITPRAGTGTAWVDATRLKPDPISANLRAARGTHPTTTKEGA